MKLKVRFFLTTAAMLALVILLNMRWGQVPALGKFLDPVKGIWQNALIPDIPKSKTIAMQGLANEATIVFNQRGVPHIFAENDYDLFFAAGYATAMHRLWQMDFTTRASMGRISEVIGESALEYDRYMLRLGMLYGAEKMLEATKDDKKTMTALHAYTDGVNAWIASLEKKHYPLEYKLLDHTPELWSPLKSLALGMNISRTLTGGSSAARMTYLKAAWGKEAVLALYDNVPADLQPVTGSVKEWNIALEPPAKPTQKFIPQFVFNNLIESSSPEIGSNNWAVSGDRSASGKPLFATDPHLSLTLPSIWYEIQLNAPGINTYGVTFPGVPSVIMGFNEQIAWGNTNTGNEVLDIYEVETNEEFTHYLHDGKWLPLTFRIEQIEVKGGTTITDTVAYTHHGPIVYRAGETPFSPMVPVSHAISWTAHETGNVVAPLQKINTAGNIGEFRSALSTLNSPTQSYAFASVSGDIAMQLNGLWPLKWRHQGMFISDGRQSAHNWQGFIPFDKLPREFNPPRGFVSSANQHPTFNNYPVYHGWWFSSQARATIINHKLESLHSATPQDMKNLQLDATNFWANKYLSQMLDSLNAFLKENQQNQEIELRDDLTDYASLLLGWNRINHAESIEATIFESWRSEIREQLWQDLMEPVKDFRPMYPSADITFRVLFHEEPVSVYKDLHGKTPESSSILAATFSKAIDNLEERHGESREAWQWWRVNGSTINHLLNIGALNNPRLRTGGSSESPNAISRQHGPSWRMVTQMTTPVKAWGIYPGGQAANPATPGYNAFVDDWVKGNYYELTLYRNKEHAVSENENIITLLPAK